MCIHLSFISKEQGIYKLQYEFLQIYAIYLYKNNKKLHFSEKDEVMISVGMLTITNY